MIIIPAIDIRGGRVVRLLQGDFSKETFYSGDPVEMAKTWEAQGAWMLHVVDLDGALTGEPKNLNVIEAIQKSVDIPIEVGGGLRTELAVESLLDKGISRAIIGTRAYTDEKFLKGLLESFDEKIIVGIDAAGDNVVADGWRSTTSINAIELAKRMEGLGVSTIIYTNVLKDGTLEKPQLEPIEDMLDAVEIDVIISGGISSLEDIKDLKALDRPNLYGVITGKALYEGKLNLTEANKVAEGA